MTLSIVLLGIAASLVAELVSLVNKWISGTAFKGQGAWWVAAVIALVAGFVKEFWFSGATVLSWGDFFTYSVVAFGISQIWFGTIATWLSQYLQVPSVASNESV
jgi:hypothetical protein